MNAPTEADLKRDAEADYRLIDPEVIPFVRVGHALSALPAWIRRAEACRKELEGMVGQCTRCNGTGREEVYHYDSASDEMEVSHTVECVDCGPARKLLRGEVSP